MSTAAASGKNLGQQGVDNGSTRSNRDGGNGQPKSKKKRGCQQCEKLIGLLQQLKEHMGNLKVKADQRDEYSARLESSERQLQSARDEIKKLRRQLASRPPSSKPSGRGHRASPWPTAPGPLTPSRKEAVPAAISGEDRASSEASNAQRNRHHTSVNVKVDKGLRGRGEGGRPTRAGGGDNDDALRKTSREVPREDRPSEADEGVGYVTSRAAAPISADAAAEAAADASADADADAAADAAVDAFANAIADATIDAIVDAAAADANAKEDAATNEDASGGGGGTRGTRRDGVSAEGQGASEGASGRSAGKNSNKRRAEEPTGVFAATAFSFLEGGDLEGGGESDDCMGDSMNTDLERNDRRGPAKGRRGSAREASLNGRHSRSQGSSKAKSTEDPCGKAHRNQSSRKRPRVFSGSSPRSSTRTPSMVGRDRLRHNKGGSLGNGEGSDGCWEGADEEEMETYEEIAGEMAGLGWSEVWRRGEAVSRGEGAGVGDGLDKASRKLARGLHDMLSHDEFGAPLGHKHLSELLRLELGGEATVEGVLVAVLRGRSIKRDAGFLGKLALRLVEGIDDAHTLPPSDPETLSLVVEELEGVADVLVAPSLEELRGLGWANETRLAVELLSKTLLGWMDEALRTAASGGPGNSSTADGFFSMSFGKSKKKKGKKKTSKNDDPKDQENGGKGEEKGFAWTAEAEAPLVYWWETDDASRVPWGIARLLGLVLRRMGNSDEARGVLHAVLVRALSGGVGASQRLLRFPLAFLEAFQGFLASPAAYPSPLSSSSPASPPGDEVLLSPGLWRRATLTALFPGGRVVDEGGGAAALMFAKRLKSVCLWGVGDAGSVSKAVDGEARGEATRLAEDVLEAIGGLHGTVGEDGASCPLCSGDAVAGGDGYGRDDALAVSTSSRGFPDLAVPLCRGELVAVEALRALRLLSLGLDKPWRRGAGGFLIEKRMDVLMSRPNICGRAASLACHVLAQCAGAGTFRNRPLRTKRLSGAANNGIARRVCETLREVVQSDRTKWETGQVTGCLELSSGAKAQAAMALLSVLDTLEGEVAADDELFAISWLQGLEAKKRLLAPIPLLSSLVTTLSRPPAHVINLSRRSDRWSVAVDIARREGVWLHRHEAIDGAALEGSGRRGLGRAISDRQVTLTWDSELNTMHDPNCEQGKTIALTPSERACAASHAALWQQHKEGLLAPFMPEVHPDAVLILEDDAQLTPGFLDQAKAAMKLASTNDAHSSAKTVGAAKRWDLLYLGHILPKQIVFGIAHAQSKAEKSPVPENDPKDVPDDARDKARDGARNDPPQVSGVTALSATGAESTSAGERGLKVPAVTYAWCLHAYLLTRDGARQLVSRMPVSAPADIFVASFLTGTDSGRPILTGRVVLPAIVKASPGKGDVESLVTLRAGGASEGMVRGLSGVGKALTGKRGKKTNKKKAVVEDGSADGGGAVEAFDNTGD